MTDSVKEVDPLLPVFKSYISPSIRGLYSLPGRQFKRSLFLEKYNSITSQHKLQYQSKPASFVDKNLADEKCAACNSNDHPLTYEYYSKYLTHLNDQSWNVVDDHHLIGSYAFSNFKDALEFTISIGNLAEDEWHHPEISLSWGEVQIKIWTHKINGLHKTDFIFAAKSDRIYSEQKIT